MREGRVSGCVNDVILMTDGRSSEELDPGPIGIVPKGARVQGI